MSAISLTPRCYIWVIAIFLFSCVLSGGTFLVLYMTQPETPTTSWYPVIGITLVCLPWFFWILTVLYRIISRALGFRMVCWGRGVLPINSSHNGNAPALAGAGDEGGAALENGNVDNSVATMNSENTKQVHFTNSMAQGGSSTTSHESEMPLKTSMAM